jgi:hypothetical protein
MMARNRIIQKTFWDDEKISEISKPARLVFIALWNLSDDYGVVKGHHVWLKNRIFPYDNDQIDDFHSWMNELIKSKFIISFKANNSERYYFIKNFTNHQFINRPSAKRNPEPPKDIIDNSMNAHGVINAEVEVEVEVKSKKKDELFKLPSKEDISESSILKLKGDLDKITKELYDSKIFPKVHTFKNQMLKKGKNERAIIHTLTRCYLKKEFINNDPWAYCTKIISVEDGNYNERDHNKATG